MSTFRYLVRLTRYQPRYFVMLAARAVSIGLIPQGIALTSRAIFDNMTSEQAATVGFWSLAAILLALAVTRSLMIFGNIILSVRVEFTFATLLRKNVFDHILDQPGNNALPESTGEAVTRFREDVDYVNKYLQRIGFAFPLLVFGVIALYIMIGIDTIITFYVFLPLAVIMVTVSAASRWLRRFRLDNREATGDVTSLLGEMFGSVEAIKVANAESRMIAEFKRLNSRRKTYTIRDTLLTQSLNSVFQNSVTIGTGLILLIAASAMRDGSFTIGDFALFVSYLYMVGWLNTEVGAVLAEYRQTGVSFDRLRGLIPSAPAGRLVQHQKAHLAGDLPDVPFAAKTDAHRLDLVEVEGLTYRYGDNGRGIEDISLRVPRGSLTVVTGRIGSGKTTLLRALLGLLPKDAGVVRWNGEPVDDLATFFVPPRSAYTSQVPRLFSEPLRDNILLGLPEDKIDLEAALNAAVMERGRARAQRRTRHRRRRARRKTVRRPDPTLRRRQDVRPRPRAPRLRRPLVRPRRRHRTAALGPPVRAPRRHRPRRLPPPRSPPPRRSRHRPQRRPRRSRRLPHRPPQHLRRNAPPLGRRGGGKYPLSRRGRGLG